MTPTKEVDFQIAEVVRDIFGRRVNAAMVLSPSVSAKSQRVLGVPWDTISDQITFQSQPGDKGNYRRGILSNVSPLFDLLELVFPLCLS